MQARNLIDWARHASGDERVWAVKDCRPLSGRLERALISAAEHVVRVPPKLMAAARTSARTRGKSDPIDALAVARVYLRDLELPAAGHGPSSREIKLMTDHRCGGTCTISSPTWIAQYGVCITPPSMTDWLTELPLHRAHHDRPGTHRRHRTADRADQQTKSRRAVFATLNAHSQGVDFGNMRRTFPRCGAGTWAA